MAIHYACLYGHWSCAQVMMEPRWVVQNPGGLRPLAQVRRSPCPLPHPRPPFHPFARPVPNHSATAITAITLFNRILICQRVERATVL